MNVLFLAFEGESIAIGALAKKFKETGDRVYVFNVDHWNIKYTKGQVFDFYRQKCGLSKEEFGHLGKFHEAINRFQETMPASDVDWDFLRDFEQNYLPSDTSIQKVFSTDTLFYRVYHHRDMYYIPDNKNIFFKAAELLAKDARKLYDEFAPDFVFSIQNQYALKFLFFQMSRKKSKLYLNYFVSRIQEKWIFTTSFHVGTCPLIVKRIEERIATNQQTDGARQFAALLKTKLKTAYVSYEPILNALSNDFKVGVRVKRAIGLIRYFSTLYLRGMVTSYRGLLKKDYFEPGFSDIIRLEFRGIARMYAYCINKLLNNTTLPQATFIYFTLHLMPESATSTMADTLNELECIYQLSLVIPVDWKIVVKINPSMLQAIDTHPNSYYMQIQKIPSVWFVHAQFPSLEIIRQSQAVACLAGTSLLEGVLMGKPGISWGKPEFNWISGIHQFADGDIMNKIRQPVNTDKAFQYVQYCLDEGTDFDLEKMRYSIHDFGKE